MRSCLAPCHWEWGCCAVAETELQSFKSLLQNGVLRKGRTIFLGMVLRIRWQLFLKLGKAV